MDLRGPGAEASDAERPRLANEAPPGRIQDLVRTYIFLNDPRARQLTMKFSVLFITLGAVGAFAYLAVSGAHDEGLPGEEPQDQAASVGAAQRVCMPTADYPRWQAENEDARVERVDVEATGVCVTYRS